MISADSDRINWQRIIYSGRKSPYGTYAFKEYFSRKSLGEQSRKRFTELDSLESDQSFLSISNRFDPTPQELKKILNYVQNGGKAAIYSKYFNYDLLDTLGLELNYSFSSNNTKEYKKEFVYSVRQFFLQDTVHLSPQNQNWSLGEPAVLREEDIYTYLVASSDSLPMVSVVKGQENNNLVLRIPLGQGQLIIGTLPYLFTNIYFLYGNNEEMVRYLLAYHGNTQIQWTEFYEVGMEGERTPFRFILSDPALKMAYSVALGLLFIFVLFKIKREQRPIPQLLPPENSTLKFVRTVGNLYLESGSNKKVAEKRIQFFFDQVRSHFYLSYLHPDKRLVSSLSKKSKSSKEELAALIEKIKFIQNHKSIDEKTLTEFSEMLDRFYQTNKI